MNEEIAEATLSEILSAREHRVVRQNEALAQWNLPLISLTIVMPGPLKDSDLTRFLLKTAITEINTICAVHGWAVRSFKQIKQIAGPEALYVVDTDAPDLKRALLGLEDTHQLGRLWDMDVIAPEGTIISRRDMGMEGRRCLACDQPGHVCTRTGAHPLSELTRVIEGKVAAFKSMKRR